MIYSLLSTPTLGLLKMLFAAILMDSIFFFLSIDPLQIFEAIYIRVKNAINKI